MQTPSSSTKPKSAQQPLAPVEPQRATSPAPTSGSPRPIGRFMATLGAIIFVGALAGFGGAWLYDQSGQGNGFRSDIGTVSTAADDGNRAVTADEEEVAGVAQKVSRSVVSIVTSSNVQSYYGRTQQQSGAGSGVIVSSGGVIMTNKHVVSGSDAVTVVLADGTQYSDVRVLGTDPLNDIAFLKIEGASDLPAATLGHSGTVRVGQRVVAIGNSLGQYQNTVTSGIISGTGRPVEASSGDGETTETLTDLLQTDAAINPGNSGGPLLNLSGQVIGINTAIVQDAQGIGFAIPIDATKGLIKTVTQSGTVQRAFLGVNFLTITPDIAKRYNLPVAQGGYVFESNGRSAVQSGSPADKAGIKTNDIITKVNDQAVGSSAGVSSLVGQYAPGETVRLTVLRGGQEQVFEVTLGAYRS